MKTRPWISGEGGVRVSSHLLDCMTLTLDKISYQNIFEQISPHRCKIESPLSQKYFTKWKENMSRSRGPAGNYNHVLYFHDEHFVILSPPHYSDGAGAGGPSDWTLGAQIFVKIGFCCLHLPGHRVDTGHLLRLAVTLDDNHPSSLIGEHSPSQPPHWPSPTSFCV